MNTKQPQQSLKAVQKLREMIFSGELSPGSDHLEGELADRLEMSRTPVREATLLLEAQGLLEVRPRKGVRILSLSKEDMHEIYDVLAELECLAAARAAQAGYSKKELGGLLSSIHDMESCLENDDLDGWASADSAFHDELVRLSGNSRLQSIVANFNDQVWRARVLTLRLRPLPYQSNADHRKVYEAIISGDAEAARRVHKQHREAAKKILLSIIENPGVHVV